jgi:hypothetical protein
MPRFDLRFCPRHHWQHLTGDGRCLWCEAEADPAFTTRLRTAGRPEQASRHERLLQQVTEESLVDAEEHVAGVERVVEHAEQKARRR